MAGLKERILESLPQHGLLSSYVHYCCNQLGCCLSQTDLLKAQGKVDVLLTSWDKHMVKKEKKGK